MKFNIYREVSIKSFGKIMYLIELEFKILKGFDLKNPLLIKLKIVKSVYSIYYWTTDFLEFLLIKKRLALSLKLNTFVTFILSED